MTALPRTLGALSALVLASPALPSPALAHGDHGGGGGVVLPPGTTLVTLSFDIADFRPVSDERLRELSAQGEGAHGIRRLAVPALSMSYGLARGLTLGVRAPYLANRSISEAGEDAANPDVIQRGGVYGFGDMTFTATYEVLHDDARGLEASIIAGFKAPTGRVDAVDRQGVLFETEHQPGSGSWDGVFGASLTKHIGALTLSGNVAYGLAGHGSQETRLGDRVSYGATAVYRLWQLPHGGGGHHATRRDAAGAAGRDGNPAIGSAHDDATHTHEGETGGVALDVSLGLNGQWWDKLTVAGVQDDNIGGHVVYIAPGLRLTVDRWAGFVSLGIPVSTHLNGIQSEPTWQLSTGVSVQF